MLLDVRVEMQDIEHRHNNDLITGLAEYPLTGYIADIISEVADHSTDVYNHDLWAWAKNNEEYVEQALFEFGFDHHRQTLPNLFAMGQYLYHTELIYQELDDFLVYGYLAALIDKDVEFIHQEVLDFMYDALIDENHFLEDQVYEIMVKIENVNGDAIREAALYMNDFWYNSFGEDMVEELLDILIEHDQLKNYQVLEIKEKFGGLRWYGGGFIDDIPQDYWDWLQKYENLSETVCLCCGSTKRIKGDE